MGIPRLVHLVASHDEQEEAELEQEGAELAKAHDITDVALCTEHNVL